MRGCSIDDEKELTPAKMLMEGIHEANQGGCIEIAFGKLKKEMTLSTDSRRDTYVNPPLSRDPDYRLDLWKCPGLAHIGNQTKQTLVSVKDEASASGCRPHNVWQNPLKPSAHLLGILFQSPTLRGFSYQTKSVKKSWHVFLMEFYPKLLPDENSHAWAGPKVRHKPKLPGGSVKHLDQMQDLGLAQFRRAPGVFVDFKASQPFWRNF